MSCSCCDGCGRPLNDDDCDLQIFICENRADNTEETLCSGCFEAEEWVQRTNDADADIWIDGEKFEKGHDEWPEEEDKDKDDDDDDAASVHSTCCIECYESFQLEPAVSASDYKAGYHPWTCPECECKNAENEDEAPVSTETVT